jgi:PIN domain nuclease of toxin-antitoxin system
MYLQADKIPPAIVTAIANENVLGIPAISLWEIAMLSNKGRIILPEDRLIAATALEYNCRLATADQLLCQFPQLKIVV